MKFAAERRPECLGVRAPQRSGPRGWMLSGHSVRCSAPLQARTSYGRGRPQFTDQISAKRSPHDRPAAALAGAVLLRRGDQQRFDPEAHPGGAPRHWGLKEINLRTYRTRGLGVKTGSEEINPRLAFRPAMTYLGLSPDHAATAQGLLDRYSETMLQGPTRRTNR
jgi:hypothetical protein